MPPVTLLTDFGHAGPYAASMKGVLTSRTDAPLHDLSHAVPRQDVPHAAFLLWAAAPYFPRGTVHCCVVDPGVGTDRRPVAVRSGDQVVVAPDNGLALPAARKLGDPEAREITLDAIDPPGPVSDTFHGRDVFAPAAAALAEDLAFDDVGPRVDPADLQLFRTEETPDGIEARVAFVDDFGNVVTSAPRGDLGPVTAVRVDDELFDVAEVATYGEGEPGELLLLEGSTGLAELALDRGSAADRLDLSTGDTVTLLTA